MSFIVYCHSASGVHCMFSLLLLAWVDPTVSGLYLPRVCIVCSCCYSRHKWTHWWVGCICLECALYVHVVTLSMSGPICEWAVSALSVHCMYLLSLLAWVDPSVSGLYLPRVCIVCTCCHSWHEWTHLWVGCICLECALYVHVVTLGMSEPIGEWAVSASSVLCMFLLLLSAWVDRFVSGLYLPRVCIVCTCCYSRHKWTHWWVGCICLECALYVLVVTLGMSEPICEWAVSALSVHCMYMLSLLAWVNPLVSGLYLPRVCFVCSCCYSQHEWTHWWVGCICLECALYVLVVILSMSGPICEWLYLPLVCIACSCCYSWHEWTHLWVGCICLECALYVLVVTLGISEPIGEWAVSASSVHCMFLLLLSA